MEKKCPYCKREMKIKEVECLDCKIRIIGDFDPSPSIPEEIFNFIKVFVFTEGNIKKVEKILNCSYPKVKSLLREAKSALGVDDKNPDEERTDVGGVLDLLKEGKITYEQAMEIIEKSK
ncbi:DUF2089 family protein [candidate division WOR-3 bacterium]|nr:DUF2089 family protein [candidate division WOR-3 bacterium]